MAGGLTGVMTMEPDPPHGASDGKLEVEGSGGVAEVEELPLPGWVVLKVQQGDLVKHILNKGLWVAIPAVQQGWQIFVEVCPPILSFFVLFADPRF